MLMPLIQTTLPTQHLTALTLCLSLSSMLLIWSYLWNECDLMIILDDTEMLESKPTKLWHLKLSYRTSSLLSKLSLLLYRAMHVAFTGTKLEIIIDEMGESHTSETSKLNSQLLDANSTFTHTQECNLVV